MSNKIEFKIDGTRLTPEKFLSGAIEFVALVQSVAKNVTRTKIEWIMEVDRGSAVLRLRPERPNLESAKSIDTVCQGVKALRNGIRTIPHGFTRENVSSAKIIAGLVDGIDVQGVFIQDGGASEAIPHTIVEVAEAILEGQHHVAFGSIEGKIVSLSAKHGFICVIEDPIQRREITCYLQTDQAQKKAIEGYTKRALAKGLIHYAKEGHAVNITVDDIRIFPPDSDLPTIEDVQAIYQSYK